MKKIIYKKFTKSELNSFRKFQKIKTQYISIKNCINIHLLKSSSICGFNVKIFIQDVGK